MTKRSLLTLYRTIKCKFRGIFASLLSLHSNVTDTVGLVAYEHVLHTSTTALHFFTFEEVWGTSCYLCLTPCHLTLLRASAIITRACLHTKTEAGNQAFMYNCT